jgi:hypothetical protein
MILSPRVRYLASHGRHRVKFSRRIQNRGGSDERAMTTVVELGWQLGFMFGTKLMWVGVAEVHLSLYRGVGVVWKDYHSN